jgi:methylated-DNA-protein-cysteine methyltransferase-like protein
MDETFFAEVYELVRQVPAGRLVTYGQIAVYLGRPQGARTVGWAMRAAPAGVPWQRVINSQGRISTTGRDPGDVAHQRTLLEAEGIVFDREGRVDLRVYQWEGPDLSEG